MPALKNARRERFAQLLASGKAPADAYLEAGFTGKNPAKLASDVRKQPDVTGRVAELTEAQRLASQTVREEAQKLAVFDRAKILLTLEDVVQRCMQYQPVMDEKGNPVMVEVPGKDGKGPTLSAAYTFDAKGAIAALRLIGMEQPDPMFVNRHEVRRNPLDMLPPEIARLIVAKLSAAAQFDVGLHRVALQSTREGLTIDQPAATQPGGPELDGQPAAGGAEGAAGGGAAKGS